MNTSSLPPPASPVEAHGRARSEHRPHVRVPAWCCGRDRFPRDSGGGCYFPSCVLTVEQTGKDVHRSFTLKALPRISLFTLSPCSPTEPPRACGRFRRRHLVGGRATGPAPLLVGSCSQWEGSGPTSTTLAAFKTSPRGNDSAVGHRAMS